MRLADPRRAVPLARTRAGDADTLADVVSARVLSHHGAARPADAWLGERARDASVLVRQQAWQLAGEAGVALDARSYAAALRDEDEEVRRDGLLAAALAAVPGALTIARKAAEKPSRDDAHALRLLAALGTRDDDKRLRYVIGDPALGPLRMELAGIYGAPWCVDVMLEAMRGDDQRTAVAAGAGFLRVTGVDVESTQRATLPPEDGATPDTVEAEFLDEALLPDAGKAQQVWSGMADRLAEVRRLCAGRDASSGMSADPSVVDLDRCAWEYVRARFERRTPSWTPPPGPRPRS
jgi:hypothetical protein